MFTCHKLRQWFYTFVFPLPPLRFPFSLDFLFPSPSSVIPFTSLLLPKGLIGPIVQIQRLNRPKTAPIPSLKHNGSTLLAQTPRCCNAGCDRYATWIPPRSGRECPEPETYSSPEPEPTNSEDDSSAAGETDPASTFHDPGCAAPLHW